MLGVNAGTIIRPDTGTIIRPNAGTIIRPDADMIIKPDAGTIIQSIPAHGRETHEIKESDTAAI